MARMWPGDDLPPQSAAVVIERHVQILRPDTRGLSRRALRTESRKHPAKVGETCRPERRPSEQTGAEDAERDGDSEFTLDPGEGRDRERHDTADDLDRARQHDRIGRTEHLQQRVEDDNGDDAGDQGWHAFYIVAMASKSILVLATQSSGSRDKARGIGGLEFLLFERADRFGSARWRCRD